MNDVKKQIEILMREALHARAEHAIGVWAATFAPKVNNASARQESEARDAILELVTNLVRERDEALAFLRRTATTGGSIVSSAAMTPTQIAVADAADRMLVMSDGCGFVYVPESKDT